MFWLLLWMVLWYADLEIRLEFIGCLQIMYLTVSSASTTSYFRQRRTSITATPSVSRLTTNRPDEALTSAAANGLWSCRLNGGFGTAIPVGIYARGGEEVRKKSTNNSMIWVNWHTLYRHRVSKLMQLYDLLSVFTGFQNFLFNCNLLYSSIGIRGGIAPIANSQGMCVYSSID